MTKPEIPCHDKKVVLIWSSSSFRIFLSSHEVVMSYFPFQVRGLLNVRIRLMSNFHLRVMVGTTINQNLYQRFCMFLYRDTHLFLDKNPDTLFPEKPDMTGLGLRLSLLDTEQYNNKCHRNLK